MKLIQKSPSSINKWLSLYRDKNQSYDIDVKNKRVRGRNKYDNILDDLLEEQGHLCAYCMRKISSENSTIEHFIGQEYVNSSGRPIGKEEDTNYQNMLAVCLGKYCKKITKDKEKLHCDSGRSNFQSQNKSNYRPKLFISPLDNQQMKQIGFTKTGVLFYKEPFFEEETMDEKEIRYDIEKVLNLNCINLKENRKRVIQIVNSSLRRHHFDKKFAQKELDLWQEKKNSYQEYCQVAIYLLKKYI